MNLPLLCVDLYVCKSLFRMDALNEICVFINILFTVRSTDNTSIGRIISLNIQLCGNERSPDFNFSCSPDFNLSWESYATIIGSRVFHYTETIPSRFNIVRRPLLAVVVPDADARCLCRQLLLAHQAEVNAVDEEGRRPIHAAARFGHSYVAHILVNEGRTLVGEGSGFVWFESCRS